MNNKLLVVFFSLFCVLALLAGSMASNIMPDPPAEPAVVNHHQTVGAVTTLP